MKVVIDIPERVYNHSRNITESDYDEWVAMRAISHGIPLPKTYGKLIDADALVRKAYEEAQGMTNNNFGVEVEWLVDKSPAILEADRRCEENGIFTDLQEYKMSTLH